MPEQDLVLEIIGQILQEVGPISDCAGLTNENILGRLECRRRGLVQRPNTSDWLTVVEKLAQKAAQYKSIIEALVQDLSAKSSAAKTVAGPTSRAFAKWADEWIKKLE